MRLIRWLGAIVALLLGSGTANAACQTSAATPLTFVASSSYDVRLGVVPQTTSGAGFSCSGSLITVVGSNSAKASMVSANGFKLAAATGDTIAYGVSADPGGSYSFAGGATIDYMNPTLLSLLTILNGGSFAPKVYASLSAGSNVAAGTYTDTLTVNWQWNVCHGVDLVGICILGETGTGTATITVSLVVAKDCRVTAPPIAFGSAALVSQFGAVSQAVAVDCTKGTTFTVAFSSGASGVSRPWRSMTSSGGDSLQYNLYRPDGTTVWDETNPLAGGLPGTGSLSPALSQSYVARINPAQAAPPAGHYTDTISVVVSY